MLKQKKIVINLNWETDDGLPPPDEVQKQVAARLRGYLHEKGLEGQLNFVENDGKIVPSLEFLMPEGWLMQDVQNFADDAKNFIVGA